MKLTLKITCVFLIFALLTSCVAATENKDIPTEKKDMPTEKEVTDFIDNFEAPESGDFINSAYDAFIKEFPAGHCDVWPNGMICFYYYDPDSPKEYGAIYLDSNGEIKNVGYLGASGPIKSYKGEYVSEGTTPEECIDPGEDTTSVDTPTDSNPKQSVTAQDQMVDERDKSDEYKELMDDYKDLLDEYKEQPRGLPAESKEQTFMDSTKKVTGQLIFDPSKKMKVGKTENIDVYITTDISKNISEEYGINETLQSRNINVTPRMKVTLVGGETGAFYIETIPPNSDGVQPIIGKNTTIWSWQVTPLKSGKQTLLLSVEYVIPLNNEDDQHYKTLKNIEEQIYVKISPYYFVECYWQWIVGIIVPVLIAIYASRKDRNESNYPAPPQK